ncbi:MAG: autotransporter domain-containing protein [Candidatus Puniceispirillaceae bacterium]
MDSFRLPYYQIFTSKTARFLASFYIAFFASQTAIAADVVFDNTSSASTVNAGDNVTVPDHAGADGNTTTRWIQPAGDDITITISGTLQGGNELIYSNADMDNLSIEVTTTGAIVSSNWASIDIDGSNRSVTNATVTNAGILYSRRGATISSEDVINAKITNKDNASISGSDNTILITDSVNSVIDNAGYIAVDDEGITYRNGQTLVRHNSSEGRTIRAQNSDNLTVINSGTIHSKTKDTIFMYNNDNSTITNSGTISATNSNAVLSRTSDNFTLTNSGTIKANSIALLVDQTTNSQITNSDNGTIKADYDFVVDLSSSSNFSVTNKGTIKSDNGSVFDADSASSITITNTGTIKTTSATTDYILSGDGTTFTNQADGIVSSTSDGLVLDDSNNFNNYGSFSVGDNKTGISITGNNNNVRFYDNSSYSGKISAGSGTGNLLTIDNDLAFTIADNISGSIALTKTGDGTLNITGGHAYTGATTVSAGTLKMNGTSAGSTITVGASGTLGGSGTSGTVINSGTIAPGNSIGTLNISGDLTLDNTSELEIEIGVKGASDTIVITGALTNDGKLKIINDRTAKYDKVETYKILDAGSSTGTFDEISMRACGASIDTSYDSDGVTITVTGCNAKRGDAVAQLESYVTAFYDENPSAEISALLTELEGLSGTDYEKALGTLDVDAPLAVAASTTQNIQTVNGFIAQRASAQSGSGARQQLRMMTDADPLSADNKLSVSERLKQHSRKGIWVKGFGGNGEKKAIKDLGVNGYDYDFQGTTIGFDIESETMNQGVALSVQQGSVTSKNKQGYQDYETVMLNYQNTRVLKNGASLALSSGLAFTKIKAKRYVDVGSIEQTAKADYQTYALDLGFGYNFAPMRLGWLTNDVALTIGANYNTQESYREKGAGAYSLAVDPKHMLTARIGLQNTMYFDGGEDDSAFLPFISTGIFGSRHLTNTAIKQGFIGADKVKVTTDRDQEVYGEVALGFLHIDEEDDELRLMTKTKFSDKTTEYSASLDYGLKF